MRWFQELPLKRKLMLVILVTCAMVLSLACAAIAVYEMDTYRRTVRHEAGVLADVLATNCQAALAFADAEAATGILRAVQADPNLIAARLFDRSGTLFAEYVRPGVTAELPSHPLPDGHQFLDGSLVMVRPIVLDGKRIGTISVRIDLRGMYDRLRLFAGIAAVVLVGSLLAAWVLSIRLQRYISGPILTLAEVAKVVAERNDYTVRAPPQGRNEVGTLTDAFNHMLTQIHQKNIRLEQQAQELARSNAELEQFTYVSSHDLKEPLRMVTMYMTLLERKHGGDLNSEAKGFIRYAVEGAERLHQLIDDILTYSRLDQPDAPLTLVALDEVVIDAIANNRSEIDRQQARISVQPLPRLLCERSQLVQLFQNLIANAVKFHGDRPPHVEIWAEREADHWKVSVRDHGIGMDPAHTQRIFDMFQRLHTRDAYPGTGIGLSICRKIVERHGGRLWVESEPGRGSTFRFTLSDLPEPRPTLGTGTQAMAPGNPDPTAS